MITQLLTVIFMLYVTGVLPVNILYEKFYVFLYAFTAQYNCCIVHIRILLNLTEMDRTNVTEDQKFIAKYSVLPEISIDPNRKY